jgi:TonB-linked SusC/RagA family outer membrane protein
MRRLRFVIASCLCLLFLLCNTAMAGFHPPRIVTGKITDEKNAPLAGATIQVKGTTKNALSKEDGSFSIEVNDNETTLVINFVGMQQQEVDITGKNELIIQLRTTGKSTLDEVVVIGYGTTRRRDLTGSVYSIKGSDVVANPSHNAIEAIQGRVPGADIVRNSGAPGSSSTIRIRGNRSLTAAANGPLYVIDGFQGGTIENINTNDIESIEILKDASATAIYGAQGANGVIIVTTKKGIQGATKINYAGYVGINNYSNYPKPRMYDDYLNLRRQAWANSVVGGVPEWQSPADDIKIFSAQEYAALQAGQWVDWFDLVNHTGLQQSHTLSVRGGNEKVKTFLSAGLFREDGMLERNNYTRYNIRGNIDYTVSRFVKTGVMLQGTFNNTNARRDPLGTVNSMVPLGQPFTADGGINVYPLINSRISPLTDERGDDVAKDNTISNNFIANGYIELAPIKGLTLRSNLGTNLTFTRRGTWNDSSSLEQANSKRKVAYIANNNTRYINWDNIATYTRAFGDHNITVTGITSYIQSTSDNATALGYGQAVNSQQYYNLAGTDPASRLITSGYTRWNNMAYAARVNYSYKGKYLLTLSERFDGASRLSPGHKWDNYPSVAAGWNLSQEKFLQDVSFLNNLKLRGSYGASGNYAIAVYGTQSGVTPYPMGFGDVSAPAYYFTTNISSPDLEWERSTAANLGLDFAILNNRISGAVDLYRTRTTRLLYSRPLPSSTGVATITQNVGATVNKGIEISLNTVNITTRNFKWNSTITFTSNSERITQLIDGRDIIGSPSETSSLLIGHPVSSFYTYQKLGIWQTSEAREAAALRFGSTAFKPGDIKLADLDGNGIIDQYDRTFIGSTVPKWVAGFQNNFSYKGFDLGVYLFARWGQMVNAQFLGRFDPSGNANGPSLDYWTPNNATNDFPAPQKGSVISSINGYQTLTYVDGSFFKIKNVTLGYTLPASFTKRFKVDNVRLYATGSNLFTKANSHLLSNYDPEGQGNESAPLSRLFVFGLNLGF